MNTYVQLEYGVCTYCALYSSYALCYNILYQCEYLLILQLNMVLLCIVLIKYNVNTYAITKMQYCYLLHSSLAM